MDLVHMRGLLFFLLVVACASAAESTVGVDAAGKMVPLQFENPPHPFGSWKIDFSGRLDPKVEGRQQPMPLVPRDVGIISRRCLVTSSDTDPVIGALAMVTDGDKSISSGGFVELGPGSQWVQIDLGKEQEIWAVVFWPYTAEHRIYRDVIVQVADDAGFTRNAHTLFNNDHDNSSGQGAGNDYEFISFANGRVIAARGVKARFVRCWSRGNTSNDLNHYVEVEVWGRSVGSSDLVPLPIEFPAMDRVAWDGFLRRTPSLPQKLHDEYFGNQPPSLPLVPRGVTNLALGRTVTASDPEPVIGGLEMITDGDKDASTGSFVELGPDRQWVQIDLGRPAIIHAVALWHQHHAIAIHYAVVVQVADDVGFTRNVRTLFNNDEEDMNKLGKGKDPLYPDTHWGQIIPAKGVKARYVRCWSHGNSLNDLNHYTEIEVWGFTDIGF